MVSNFPQGRGTTVITSERKSGWNEGQINHIPETTLIVLTADHSTLPRGPHLETGGRRDLVALPDRHSTLECGLIMQ